MNYNDYPILSDEQYKLMQDKFNEQNYFDRKENSYSIYLNLKECTNSITFLYQKVNAQICEQLKIAKQSLEKATSNFEATFNLPNKQAAVKETNLFNLLKNLAKIQKKLANWLKFEQKEYFRQFILNLLEDVSNILFGLLNAVENSEIRLFKHF